VETENTFETRTGIIVIQFLQFPVRIAPAPGLTRPEKEGKSERIHRYRPGIGLTRQARLYNENKKMRCRITEIFLIGLIQIITEATAQQEKCDIPKVFIFTILTI
jgi:hypothetical protein